MKDHQIKCPECGSEDNFFEKDGFNCICRECNHKFKKKIKPLRIFLSYGRDDHAAVAWKLKEDLQKKGHKVWFDNERLKTGVAWENYIERGLDWVSEDPAFGRVVLVMTPHSIRRENPDIPDSDDGYCLNEIHRALQKKVDVIPVMLVWCEPPLSICRVQWLDMMDCLPPEENESNYHEKFDLLLESLEEGEVKHGFQTSLKTLLEPLEFDVEILKHVRRFTGRKWVFDAIDEWIKTPNTSRIFWICGEAGTGKTAIASWLCERRRKAAAFHLCQHNDTIKSDPRRSLMSIAYQLSTQIPDYHEQLRSLQLKKLTNEMNVSTLFSEIIAKPLSKIPEPEEVPLIILIDALDEATKDGKNELADFISRYFHKNPEETPEWLRVIITSRGVSEVKGPLQGINPYILDTGSPENFKDIEEYLKKELKPFISGYQVEKQALTRIIEKSEGNFLYVEWIRRELEEGNLSIEKVNQFPKGLGSIYFDFFSRNFHDIDYYEEKIAPALDIISAAQEPLELDFIASIMNWNGREKRRFQRKTDSLFITKDDKIQPFHKSLLDWLKNSEKAGDYYVSEEDGHKKLAQIGWKIYKNDFHQLPSYFLSHIPKHLIRSGCWDEVQEILTDLNYIEVKCAAGMTYQLIEDYNLTLKALPEVQGEIQRKIEDGKQLKKYTQNLVSYGKEEIDKLQIINSIKPWSPKRIIVDKDRINNHPTRLDTINAFFQFVNSQSHALIEFGHIPSFCLQQAYNSASSGPVSESAKEILKTDSKNPIILRDENWLPKYNPHPSLFKTLEGHKNLVRAVAISADGRIAVSGGDDRTVRVWDLETGRQVKVLEGHIDYVSAVAISADGRIAVSGGDDRTVRVWDLETGEQINKLGDQNDFINVLSITPNAKIAIIGSNDYNISIWNLDDGELVQILGGHTKTVTSISITPDFKTAITGSLDKTVRVWDLESVKQKQIFKDHKNYVNAVAISADGRIAVSGGDDRTVRVWDLETGRQVKVLEGHVDYVSAVAISADGRIAVSGGDDRTVRVWNLETAEQKQKTEGHVDLVSAISVTPDGNMVISESWDKTARVWSLDLGIQLKKLDNLDLVSAVSVTPDSKRAIINCDNNVKIWDLETGKNSKLFDGFTKSEEPIIITPDGRLIIIIGENIVHVMNIEAGKLVKILEGHVNDISALAITPDGKFAITGSSDLTVRVWDLESGKQIQTLEGHVNYVNYISVTPDAKTVITRSGDRILRVWNLKTGKQINTLEGHTRSVKPIFVTPDGNFVITGSNDRTVRIWDLKTGKQLQTLHDHTHYINTLFITSDGNFAITGSSDSTVRGWHVKSGQLIFVSKEQSDISSLVVKNTNLVFGTNTGDIFVSKLIKILDLPLITPIRIWLYGEKGDKGCWDDNITANCHWCGNLFKVKDITLNMIKAVGKNYKKSDGWISNEAWEDPRLVSKCPVCKKKIRFNPFIVDNKS